MSRCKAITNLGKPCRQSDINDLGYCKYHKDSKFANVERLNKFIKIDIGTQCDFDKIDIGTQCDLMSEALEDLLSTDNDNDNDNDNDIVIQIGLPIDNEEEIIED